MLTGTLILTIIFSALKVASLLLLLALKIVIVYLCWEGICGQRVSAPSLEARKKPKPSPRRIPARCHSCPRLYEAYGDRGFFACEMNPHRRQDCQYFQARRGG